MWNTSATALTVQTLARCAANPRRAARKSDKIKIATPASYESCTDSGLPPFLVPVVMFVLARFPGRADQAVAHPRLGANQPVVARRVRNELNVAFCLQADLQSPEIDVRLYPSFRHSRQGWEGLKVTLSGSWWRKRPVGANVNLERASVSGGQCDSVQPFEVLAHSGSPALRRPSTMRSKSAGSLYGRIRRLCSSE